MRNVVIESVEYMALHLNDLLATYTIAAPAHQVVQFEPWEGVLSLTVLIGDHTGAGGNLQTFFPCAFYIKTIDHLQGHDSRQLLEEAFVRNVLDHIRTSL